MLDGLRAIAILLVKVPEGVVEVTPSGLFPDLFKQVLDLFHVRFLWASTLLVPDPREGNAVNPWQGGSSRRSADSLEMMLR